VKPLIKILSIIIFLIMVGCEHDEGENVTVVTTEDVGVFYEGIYIFKGNIVSMGEEEITNHGFCWCESGDPDLESSVICLGKRISPGSFSYTISDFKLSTTYYVKAWATEGDITYYGEVKSFTTSDTLSPFVVDIDHNIYYTVNIGNQTWMADNLKTRRYSDGTGIQLVEDRQAWYDFSMYANAYCWYENYAALGATYGALYTWPAAMRVTRDDTIKPGYIQGVCPLGWHLPGDSEWKQLEMYLGMSQSESDKEEWRGTDEGGKLKHENQYWESPNTGATNQVGFSAIPGGWRDGAGYFINLGTAARFWAASIRGDYAWVRGLDYNSSAIYRGTKGLYEAHSVRCIKDE
jgi:uncharacterized protein (TIGR02145 family)